MSFIQFNKENKMIEKYAQINNYFEGNEMIETNAQPVNYLMDSLKGFKLTAQDLTKEVEYLIPGFLVNQSLNMLFAKAGQGKSFLMLSIAISLIEQKKIKNCFYLDMDNSLMALKSRKLDTITDKYPNLHYIHGSKLIWSSKVLLEKLAYEARNNSNLYENNLVIFDSIRDFLSGRDMNSDREILPIMSQLKDLREAGATVIFLHHTTKESDGKEFKGSTSFLDSVDVAYALNSRRNENILNYVLTVYKDRISVEDCAFELDTSTMILTSENLQYASMSKNEAEFTQSVAEVLEAFAIEGITQSKLLETLGTDSNDKTARKYLQKYTGEIWITEKRPQQNNATYYFPLPNVPETPKASA